MFMTNIDRLIFTRYGGDELFSEYVYLTICSFCHLAFIQICSFQRNSHLKIDYGHLNFFVAF